jgi:WD40 repeat protein
MLRTDRFAFLLGLSLFTAAALAPSAAPGQAPLDPVAAAKQAASRQEHAWITREATAALVPSPGKLSGIARWTIDTRRHRGGISAAAMSADGARVATAGFDGIIRIWNVDSGALERAIMAHRWNIKLLAWSPDGRWLASQAVFDGAVRVFDAATGRMAKELPGHFGVLAWAPDSRRLAASGGGSGNIVISDNLGEFKPFKEMGSGISAMDWSPDGRLAVAAGGSGVVVLDGSAGRELFELEETFQQATTQIAWSPDGKLIASGGYAGALLSDGSSGKQIRPLGKAALRCGWSADSKQVAVFDGGGVVVYAADGSGESKRQTIAANYLLAWRGEPGQIVAVGAERIEVWKPDGAKPEATVQVALGLAAPVFVPGRPIVAGLQTSTLSLWDPAKFTRIARLEGHTKPVAVARWSPDGELLATADAAGTVRTWKADGGDAVATFAAAKWPITLLEWSGDGKAIAVAGLAGPVHVFAPTGEPLATLPGHAGGVNCVEWGATEEQLASGGNDGKAVIWDVTGGTPRRSIDEFGKVTALAWQRGGQLAVGCQEGGLVVVNPMTGAVAKHVLPLNRGSPNPVRSIAWVTGGAPRLLFGQSGLVRAVDLASGTLLQRQPAQATLSQDSSLSLSKNVVATPSGDRTVRFWNAANGKLIGFLVDDGEALASISATGDLANDPEAKADLIAVVEREDGQESMTLDDFAKACGWKNNPKSIKLPTK